MRRFSKILLISAAIVALFSILQAEADVASRNLFVQEIDGSPSGKAKKLKLPNGSLTDDGAGVWTIGYVSNPLSADLDLGGFMIEDSTGIRFDPDDDGVVEDFFDTNGNLGIGTTVPDNVLDVNGGIDSDTLNTGQGDNELYSMNQDVETSDTVVFSSLGIGTSSPNAILHVNAATNSMLLLTDSTTGTTFGDGGYILQQDNDMYVYNQEAGNLYLGTNVTETILGNVGIGTTVPVYTLDVTGDVNTTIDYHVGDVGLSDTTSGASGVSLVGIPELGTATYDSLADHIKLFSSTGRATGGAITDAGSQQVNVAAGTGFIKTTDSDTAEVLSCDWAASNGNAIATDTIKYIGVKYDSGSCVVTVETDNTWDLDTEFPLGSVINQADDLYTNSNPWWVTDGITNIIERFQADGYVVRDNYVGGLKIGTFSANTTRKPTLSAGTVWSRLDEFAITAKDCSGADTFYAFYRDGGTGWTRTAAKTDIDDFYDDNSGTLQALDTNKYVNFWVFVEIDTANSGQLMIIYPQNQYTIPTNAENEAIPTFPTPWYEHGILVGRITIRQGVTAPIAVQTSFNSDFGYSLAADHANLSNLVYTASGHTGDANDIAGFDGAGAAAYVDTFTELNTAIADKTLVNEEDAITLDSLLTTSAGINLGTSQSIVATTGLTIGNNTETVAINSSDWDIDATGIGTGFGNFTSNGTIEADEYTEGGTTTLSNDISGNAATVTTNANLTGEVTSVGNATTITDSVAVTSWNLTTPTITTSLTTDSKTISEAEIGRLDGLAGIIATDATAVTDLEGTGLSIGAGTLNWAAASTDLSDTANIALLDAANTFTNVGSNTFYGGSVGIGTTDVAGGTLTVGDGTNSTLFSTTGAITQEGSATLTLQDGSDLVITANANAAPFLANSGDTGTGAWDFGGADSFEIPQDKTVSVDGQITIDGTTGQLRYHDGTAQRVNDYNLRACGGWFEPADADDDVLIYIWKRAGTVSNIFCQTSGGTSAAVVCGDGTNKFESITCDADGQADDGSITNATFTANEAVKCDVGTVTGTVDSFIYCMDYVVSAD